MIRYILKPTIYNPPGSVSGQRLKPNSGFTLVELIIYMGLLTMLILIFTQIFTSILDNQLSSESNSQVAEDGRYIYSRFIYDVNRAQSIVTPANLGDSSNTLSLIINNQAYNYASSSGNLLLTDPTGSYALNGFGTKISNLQFTKIGNVNGKPTVRINFTIVSNISLHGVSETKSFQTTAGLR